MTFGTSENMKATVDDLVEQLLKEDRSAAIARWVAFMKNHDGFTVTQFVKELRQRADQATDEEIRFRLGMLLNGLAPPKRMGK